MAGRARVGQARTGRGLAVVGLKVGLLAALAAGLSACAGWDTWPPSEAGDSIPNRDDAAVTQTMTASLARVIADYPPRGGGTQRVAVNLPERLVSEAVYRQVAREVEGEIDGDRVVVPLSEDAMDLPVYHVAGIRIRTNKAYVDVLRPIFGVGELDRTELTNDAAYEGYTVHLSGGFRPWHVTWVERFSPGIIPAPAINPIDRSEPEALPEALPEAMPEPTPEESPEFEDAPEMDDAPAASDTPGEDPQQG